MLLLIVLLILIQKSSSNIYTPEYNVTSYNSPILHDYYGTGYLYSDVWQTLHFIDIQDISTQMSITADQIEDLEKICNNFEQCSMNSNFHDLRTDIRMLIERVSALIQITDNRTKRGLINGIGVGLKYLFGTMDSDDADHIAFALDNVYNHSSNSIILIKKQTSLVQNLIKTLAIDEKNYKDNMLKLRRITAALQAQQQNELLLQEAFRLNLNFFALNDLLTAIEDSIQADKTGLISPLLITPKNFVDSLQKINDHHNEKSNLFAISLINYHLFMKLSSVQILLYNNKLVYKIDTPIPVLENYDVIKLTSLPSIETSYLTSKKYFIYSNLADKTIYISKDKNEYTPVVLSECTKLNKGYFCKVAGPISRLSTNNCLFNILQYKDINCDKKWLSIQKTFILNLNSGHSWFILPITPLHLTLTCQDTFYTTIEYPSILFIANDGIASNDNVMLLPTKHNQSPTLIHHNISFKFSKAEQNMLNNNFTFNSSFSSHLSIEELKMHAHTLTDKVTVCEEYITLAKHNSLYQDVKQGFQLISYFCISLVFGCILHNLGMLRCIFRPFLIAFRFCFDNRPNNPHVNLQDNTEYRVQYIPVETQPVLAPSRMQINEKHTPLD